MTLTPENIVWEAIAGLTSRIEALERAQQPALPQPMIGPGPDGLKVKVDLPPLTEQPEPKPQSKAQEIADIMRSGSYDFNRQQIAEMLEAAEAFIRDVNEGTWRKAKDLFDPENTP